MMQILIIIGGLVLILVGANGLTDGASAIARRLGISDLVVGLTVVAFGTSAPELVITVMSAADGNTGLAIGNVVGSNTFNILAIIGVTAMIKPIKVERTVMTREVPMLVISSLVLLALGNAPLLDNGAASVVSRTDGVLLLVFFGLFMWYTFSTAKHVDESEPLAEHAATKKDMPTSRAVLWVLAGLAMLVYGGNLFVSGATKLATTLGVSDAVIGLTIAAAGTSLPELATSAVAACKGKTGLAVGNVIGSNIFNIFLVLGVGSTVHPIPFGSIGNLDLGTLMGASVLFLLFGWIIGRRTITRGEGAAMFSLYVAYIAILIAKLP